jgi:hypothetical protein
MTALSTPTSRNRTRRRGLRRSATPLVAAAVATGGLLAAGAVWADDLLGTDAGLPVGLAPGTALVIDANAGRDGRELVDSRLRDVDAEVRLPRTAAEARRNVRYLDAQGYRLVVAGPNAASAAAAAGVAATRAEGLGEALAAVESR